MIMILLLKTFFYLIQNWLETDLGPFADRSASHVRPQPDGESNLLDLSAFAKM